MPVTVPFNAGGGVSSVGRQCKMQLAAIAKEGRQAIFIPLPSQKAKQSKVETFEPTEGFCPPNTTSCSKCSNAPLVADGMMWFPKHAGTYVMSS